MEKEQTKENILPSTKSINLMELLPKAFKIDKETFKFTPSEYIKELSLSMEERHKRLYRISNNIRASNWEYPPDIRIIPHILIFQRFEAMSTNRLIVEVKNVGKTLLPIKMRCPNSTYFSANFVGPPVHRLAAGLSVEFEVIFTPKEEKDYQHVLVFMSKEETFQIPIVAIGPRAMLDIPDQIIVSPSPVKISTSKFIVVRNIGNAPAVFNFTPQGTHFQATPAKGILAAGDSLLLNVSFESSKVEEVTETLQLSLETGEKFQIILHGSAENVCVRLDKNSVVHEDTFMGLKRGKTVRLINNSSSPIKFCWKKNKTAKEDLETIESMKEKYAGLSELEKMKDARVIYYGLSNAEKHKLSCERILQDELRLLDREEFKFSDEVFSIFPETGEVWPKGAVEMIVSFEPKKAGPATAEAYLDVSGRDSRLPLRMKGCGVGPNIILNVRKIDIDFIFLCSLHKYEVQVENIGDIPGSIEHIEKPLVFGGKAEVFPLSYYLKPGEVASFFISFSSNRQGEFTEKFHFVVKESGEKRNFILKGKVISPSLNFDITMIDFGIAPFGIPVERDVNLHNLSVVPVKFSLRVTPDGDSPSISVDKFANFTIKPQVPQNPKEFRVEPEESVVEPFSSKKVTVILTSNKEGRYSKQLVVDLWGAENGSESCAIRYTTKRAVLTVSPKTIVMPSCFINYPYTTLIVVKNNEWVPGFFYIASQDPNSEEPYNISTSVCQGLLKPGNSIEIDVTIILNALGKQYFHLNMLTFGYAEMEEVCAFSCTCQGPVLEITPTFLNWGEVNLLETVTREVEITNESPVPAQVSLFVEKGKNLWSVTPDGFTILPQKTEKLTVELYLKDCGNYKGNLRLDVYNGKASHVSLCATGVGYSLVMTPKLSPFYFLGTLFSKKTYQFEISIENMGNKTYYLIWSSSIDYKAADKDNSKHHDKVFKMFPNNVEINALEKVSVFLQANSEFPGNFKQTFYCFGNTGPFTHKELLTSYEAIADFVEPKITCDKKHLHFIIKNSSESDTSGIETKISDTVNLYNTTTLPIEISASITRPFFLVNELDNCITGLEFCLSELQDRELRVKFETEENESKFSKTFNGQLTVTLKDHSKTINILLTGKMCYPNISIQPKIIDFGYLEVGTNASREVRMLNTSPLMVYYNIKWNTIKSYVIPIEKPVTFESFVKDYSDQYPVAEGEGGESEEYFEENQNREDEPSQKENPADATRTLVTPEKPVLVMPEVEISDADIKLALFPITRNYYNCDDQLIEAYKMIKSPGIENSDAEIDFTKFCDITPFYGTLEPHCSQFLSVAFSSKSSVQLYVEAVIQVDSGPEEVLIIKAISSEVEFQLSTTELDFGKQLFCETKSQALIIRNLAAMPFSFDAVTEESGCEIEKNFPLGRGMMTVSPNSGTVGPYENMELIVRYHPGVPGKFESQFELQIAHLEPCVIKVKGMGVFPQVYVALPRPEILKIDPEVGYTATASITPDWFVTGPILKSLYYSSNPLKPYRSRESNVGDVFDDDSGEEKWEFIRNDLDCLPSEIDIYLAIERVLAYNLIPMDTSKAIFAVYARTIPGFTVPAYDLDFGVCLAGTAVEQQIKIMNFGPLSAVIYGVFDAQLKQKGIFFRLKNRNELKICSCLSFTVTFHPKRSYYKEMHEKLETVFYFEIYHGPKIPIRIFAEVTYPHVIPSMTIIDFEEVVCGCCKVIYLRLKNPGFLAARWYISSKKKDDVKEDQIDESFIKPEGSMFYLDYYSGTLNPEEYCTVQVFFKPEYGDKFSAALYINVLKGRQKIKILLSGSSVEPKLTFSKNVLDFKSTLPFPYKAEKIFSISNPCAFPVEFFFSEFDEQILGEEKILRAVILYYETNEILLPVREPGETLPVELRDFYNTLLDALNAKFIENEREKMLTEKESENFEESTSVLQFNFEEETPGSTQSFASEKKKKKLRKFSRSKTAVGSSRDSVAAVSTSRDPIVPPIFEQKSSEEIQDLLEEFITNDLKKDFTYDPVQAAIKNVLPPEQEEEYRDGTLIICYGAPFTNSILLANRLALLTKMTVLNIDNIVLTEAALGRCEAGVVVKDLIEQAYSEYIQISAQELTSYNAWEENEFLLSEGSHYDFDITFDEIQRKFAALVELREKAAANKWKTEAPSGSKSDTSRKVEKAASAGKIQMDLNAPIANITEALVVDILRYRLNLEIEDGLIIEGLQSVLMTSTTNALISVLKAVGNVKDIIVVFFLNNYDQYNQNQLNLQAEQELLKYYFQEEVLQILEEEPVEVFESLNLSQEDADFFREQYLTRRREGFSEFLVKKNAFYEIERLKREALEEGRSFHMPFDFAHDLLTGSDKKEKEKEKEKESGRKKEAGKNLFTSETESRKTGSEAKSTKFAKPVDTVADSFLAFEMDMVEMKAIIDNWDQRLGALVIDSVSEVKTKKGQTPRRADSAALNLPKIRRGIFSWLVDVSKPNSNSFLACCCYLKSTLQGRFRPSESDNWPLTSPQSLSFSVVPLPPKRRTFIPQNVFTITATENITLAGEDFYEELYEYPTTPPASNAKLNRSLSSASLKSKSKESRSSRRRKTESRMSVDVRSQKPRKSSLRGMDENQLKPRCILPPGALQSYKVKYYPMEPGNFTHDYIINLVNWNAESVVKCLGICDIPRIDISPYNMFWNSSTTVLKTSAFSQEKYCASHFFNFGQIIVRQSNNGKSPVSQSTTFTFINISTLPVDMRIVFGEEGSTYDPSTSEYFLVEPNALWIMPGEKKEVKVTAIPAKVGVILECLMLIIKDNPQVECIKVMFEAAKASLTATPKVVNFDKLLLRRNEVRQLVLENENSISLYFMLKGLENLPEFSFSRVNGLILAKESLKLEITYHAKEAQIINEQPVEVLVFDSVDLEDVVQEIYFGITAEAYDVALDIIFSTPDTDEIDFGDTRVEREYSVEFSLKNVGKYLLSCKFEINNEFLKNCGNPVLYCAPQEGKLIPGKLFPVTANFLADTEISWRQEPLIKIWLMEPTLDDDLIATVPLQVTARSYFSRYEIRPLEELNFGHITVGATTTGYIKIENTGHFSLAYYIELFSVGSTLEEKGSAKTRKSSKMSSASKEKVEKGKKGMMTTIKAGIFEIFPCTGVVEIGQQVVISVTCTPTEVRSYQDKIIIFVNESLPHLRKGSPLTIFAEACLPMLDLKDYKNIFREHVVCNEESELLCRSKSGPYTIYTMNDNLFSIKNVCVGKAAEARIYLQNTGLINCSVKVSVEAEAAMEIPRSSAVDKSPAKRFEYFRLAAEKLIIEPYTSGTVLLTFEPDALEVYRAKLTITLEMPEGYENIVQVFDLFGSGILPQIEITEPSTRLPEGQALVSFPPTSPGRSSTASIAFSNIGVLDCKVIMELYKPAQPGVFTLFPKPSTEKMLKIWELAKLIEHTVIVSLSPGEVAEFNVMFNPTEMQNYSSLIKLYIVDNPFENWCFKLSGEVFFEEVIIEKIRTSMPFLNGEEAVNDSKLTAPVSPGQYFVNFGDCYVKKKSKVLLRLSNKTEKEYFKFEWEEVQNISVSPAVGHLYPNSYKEILLVFQPEEPVELDYTLTCTLNKILFGSPLGPSWDSRLAQSQKKLKGDVSARSVDRNSSSAGDGSWVCGKEPLHEIIPESSKILYLNLSGIADYARLTCETTKINFKDTFMFQTRIFPLVLENSGNVPLEYKVFLNLVSVWPLKEHKKSQVDESLLRHYRSNSRPQSSQLHSRSESSRQSDSRYGKGTRPATCVVMDFNEIIPDKQQPTSGTIEEETPSYFNPFSIENATGRILPRQKACCEVKFSPMDINEFKTTITIQVASLHPECRLPEIEVTASSLMPYCHFDVPESDYLESGRREYSRPGPIGFCPGVPLPAGIKTIEIKVLGVGITVPVKFHGINPTEDDYTFSWVNITQTQPDVIQSFHCSTLDGWIRAGRQQLMIFSFVSQTIGITESFWKFSIPKYGVEATFLFVGDVRQPAVCFLSNHLNLRPTLIGCTSTDDITMVNHEDKAFDFSFVPESLYSEGCLNALQVKPRSGKILPNSEKSIRVIFTGKIPGKTLFNLKCKVKRMKEPFIIPVEVTTYAVRPMVTFEDFEGTKNFVELNKENLIDFGSELTPQVPKTITFTLVSLSRTSYYYEWEYDESVLESRHCFFQFSVSHGHVASFSREKCGLTITFTRKSSLIKFPLSLKIRRGPTFYFLITGSASHVTCEFSFNHYDFGYCFLQEKDICFNEASLVLVNRNTTTILVECNLPENTGFSYVLPQTFIYPSEHLVITIRFHPKECIPYEGVLTVTINGNQERMIHLTGHGTEFKVGLADVEDTIISLGAVKVGKKSSRKFCLANKSLAVATLLVGFCDQLPVNGEYLARPEESDLDLSQDHRLTGMLTLNPSTVFQIRPNETFPIEVTLSPNQRSSPFSETVCLQCQEKAEPICLVTGCSLGAEISLDRNFLNFGAVVESCTSDLRLKIVNSGSIGARFVWSTESLTDYSVSPTQGCCPAESDVTITVTFCPTAVQNYIKQSVECKFYLSESESYPSQWLNLIGDCMAMPEPKEVVKFQCFVREKDTKEVTIENPTGNEWQLIPVISGEYFTGIDVLVVSPLSTATYQVDYCPLTMTQENDFHEGSVFFKPPNGQGLVYEFVGISLPPNPEETIERDVPCKTKYVELLKIKNWLQHPQRFKTNIIFLEDVFDPTCTCTGFEYLEVPALAQKEYSLNFFAYNVGAKKFQVKFVNEETDEYIWYNFIFNVTMCGPLEVINLKSGVRQTCNHEIKLENPLSTSVEYKLDVENPEVHYESNSYFVPPEQSIYITVSYTPIHPGEKVVMLNASCPELGVFPRELRLTAIEEVPGNPRVFETPLGTSQTQEFVITNISTVHATFVCKLYSDDFSVTEQGSIEAGQSTSVKVTYEPTEIGTTSATLFVESEEAGNFTFPLLGMSTKPIAKGPFILKPGSAITIPFKNVFNKTKEFHMHVDNQAFTLKTAQELLSAKEECKISVTFQKLKYLERLSEYQDAEIQKEFPMMGQLIVTCVNPFVKWQFYLKGVFEK